MSLTKTLEADAIRKQLDDDQFDVARDHITDNVSRVRAQIQSAAERLDELRNPPAATPRRLLDTLSSDERKRYPMCSGLLDYFPDALAEAANVSWEGNEKHNPGEPLHWARGKSMDHADCIMRHLSQRGGFDGKIRHSAALLWRAAALLQEELEAEKKLSAPRGAS